MPQKLSNEMITAAIDGFEQQKARIDSQIAELRAMLPGTSAAPAASAAPRKAGRRGRGKMSAEGRARIAEAQRKRWAVLKGESESPAAGPVKKKRRLSAAGRKAIIDATKKRWALKRAEAEGHKKPGPAKKAAKAAKKGSAKKNSAASAPATEPAAE